MTFKELRRMLRNLPKDAVQRKALEQSKTINLRPIASKMNKLEARYADKLAILKATGQIRDYRFTGKSRKEYRLDAGGGHYYTPDFYVWNDNGNLEYHEVKGYAWTKDVLRFDGAAEKNPDRVFKMLTWSARNGWEIVRLRNYCDDDTTSTKE